MSLSWRESLCLWLECALLEGAHQQCHLQPSEFQGGNGMGHRFLGCVIPDPFSLSASSLLLRTSAACEILHSYWEPSNFGLKPLKPWDKINAFSFICFCLIFYHSNRNVSRTLVRPSRSGKPFFTISKCAGPETTEERKRCVKAVSLLLICFPLIFLRLEFQHLFLSSL